MAEPAQNQTQMTVDELAAVVQQLQDTEAGDTPVAVNVGNRLVLPVLHSAVRFHRGQSYLELRPRTARRWVACVATACAAVGLERQLITGAPRAFERAEVNAPGPGGVAKVVRDVYRPGWS